MFTKRFISLLIAITLLAVTVLVVRDADATASLVDNVDSATHSYTAWAKAAEAGQVDSATRSYIAQARAVACNVDTAYSRTLDSATRSYIAWGFASDRGAMCR